MPWKKMLVLEARTEFVLAVKAGGGSFASRCRDFGISRKTGYKWWKRYRSSGAKALAERSREPRRRAREHPRWWREALRKARKAAPKWGAKKLRWVLERSHGKGRAIPGVSTLARWLREMHLVGGQHRRARRGPVLKCAPLTIPQHCNEVWTIDFKGWFRTGDGRRCDPLTVRDLHSRFVLAVVLLSNQSDQSVRTALRRVFLRYGLPKVIRVDNGAPFGGRGALGLSRLSVWWVRLGIGVEFIRRAHPQDNAAHEQMHRVFKAETADPPAASRCGQQRRTRQWIISYNQQRPHEALGQKLPAGFYRRSRRPMRVAVKALRYRLRWEVRQVRRGGFIKWRGRLRFVGRAFVGQRVGLKAIEPGVSEVYLGQQLLGLLYARDATGLRAASLAPRK